MVFNAFTFLVAIAAVVRISRVTPDAFAKIERHVNDKHGMRAVLDQRAMIVAIALVFLVALLGLPVVQLTPVLADDVYNVGAGAYGMLLSAFGVGSLFGATALAAVGHNTRRSRIVPVSFGLFGVALLVAGLVTNYWIGLLALALAGLSFAVSTSNLHAAVQLLAPPSQRGRAIALYLIALRGGSAIGLLVLSWITGLTSAPFALTCAGTGFVAIAVITLSARASVRIID